MHQFFRPPGLLFFASLFICFFLLGGSQNILSAQNSALPTWSNYENECRPISCEIELGPVEQKSELIYHFGTSVFTPYHSHNLNTDRPVKSSINWTAFTVTSVALAGMYTGLLAYGNRSRWDVRRVPFYFKNDFSPQGLDKIGHFYALKTQASIISNLYGLSGVKPKTAALLGAGLAFSVQSLVEIKDGTISGGGFDTFDQIANTLGAGWFYTRESVPFVQRFNFRWFYYPSNHRQNFSTQTRLTEDYNGHIYFVSMRMWDLLPEQIQPFWPKFIAPAAGISLNNWSPDPNQNGELSYHLSLNLDFKHILPQKSAFGRTVSEFLNGFYIPAPAFEVYPNPSVKLIFFGQN